MEVDPIGWVAVVLLSMVVGGVLASLLSDRKKRSASRANGDPAPDRSPDHSGKAARSPGCAVVCLFVSIFGPTIACVKGAGWFGWIVASIPAALFLLMAIAAMTSESEEDRQRRQKQRESNEDDQLRPANAAESSTSDENGEAEGQAGVKSAERNVMKVVCQKCRTVAEVPDNAAGMKGKCRQCGAVVHVPGGATKICSMCGTDVSRKRRFKNAQGSYFCEPCWQETPKRANSGMQPLPENNQQFSKNQRTSAEFGERSGELSDQLRTFGKLFVKLSDAFFQNLTTMYPKHGLKLGEAVRFEVRVHMTVQVYLLGMLNDYPPDRLIELVRTLCHLSCGLMPNGTEHLEQYGQLFSERFSLYASVIQEHEGMGADTMSLLENLFVDLISFSGRGDVPNPITKEFAKNSQPKKQGIVSSVTTVTAHTGMPWIFCLKELFAETNNIESIPTQEFDKRVERGIEKGQEFFEQRRSDIPLLYPDDFDFRSN